MSINIHDGMITQLFTNSYISPGDINNVYNYSICTKILNFDTNNILTLSRDYDSYLPQYLVIHLYPNQNQHLIASEYIHNVCSLFNKMRIVMQVSGQTVLQLPLSLLYELKPAELHNNKIYIKIPFEAIFNKINVIGLHYSNVTISIQDFVEINNYANEFSLVTKVYIHDSVERNTMTGAEIRSFIQQIGTLYVANHDFNHTNTNTNANANNGRTFQIRTDILNGPTKGFLIQCNIQDLTSIKFYINNLLRFDYDPFLILSACVKISENLLYFPFNDFPDFMERGSNTFAGSINLSRLENSTLCLQFSRDQPKVVIHNIYFNYFRQSRGLGGLHVDYRPAFIANTIADHPILPIIGTLANTSLLDMSGNYIHYNLSPITSFNSQIGGTGTFRQNQTGLTGPPGLASNYTIPNGNTLYRIINTDRNTCNITHEDIASNQRYMTCSGCGNNFIESAIKQWLRQRTGHLRTCPTCREVWTNFNVYINQNEEVLYSMPE